MEKITIKSFAKINLTLLVENKRADGFHNLKSIMQTISLHDKITVRKSESLKCYSSNNKIPSGDENLAAKAAKEFFNFTKIENSANIIIEKKIPTKAGLGGGSSNAAATLIALTKLYSKNLTQESLIEIAQKIGSDVPFFLFGSTALVEGRGEKIKKLTPLKNCSILVVKPNWEVSTAEAFSKLDEIKNSKHYLEKIEKTNKIVNQLENSEDLNLVAPNFFNDFEQISAEESFKIKQKLVNLGALNSLLTGSGSAIFGIFSNYEKALNAKNIISESCKTTFLCNNVASGFEICE